MTTEKARKKSAVPIKIYVNQNAYPQGCMPVDNSCGKVCGECGKLAVFNRYPATLPVENPCISLCINREIRGCGEIMSSW
jgi:hypothetical protein